MPAAGLLRTHVPREGLNVERGLAVTSPVFKLQPLCLGQTVLHTLNTYPFVGTLHHAERRHDKRIFDTSNLDPHEEGPDWSSERTFTHSMAWRCSSRTRPNQTNEYTSTNEAVRDANQLDARHVIQQFDAIAVI